MDPEPLPGEAEPVIPARVLRRVARQRLKDARTLLEGRRYDCAAYICGYAVELALKARICRTLRWDGYPETRAEFDGFSAFRVHDLETLLSLTGRRPALKNACAAEWTLMSAWAPEWRYRVAGSTPGRTARRMVDAAETLLEVL